jgi:hypothetical protein
VYVTQPSFEQLYKFAGFWAGLVSRQPRNFLAALCLCLQEIKRQKFLVQVFPERKAEMFLTWRFSAELESLIPPVGFLLTPELRGVALTPFPPLPIVESEQVMSELRDKVILLTNVDPSTLEPMLISRI